MNQLLYFFKKEQKMERTKLKLKYQLSSLYIQIINDNGKLYKNLLKLIVTETNYYYKALNNIWKFI